MGSKKIKEKKEVAISPSNDAAGQQKGKKKKGTTTEGNEVMPVEASPTDDSEHRHVGKTKKKKKTKSTGDETNVENEPGQKREMKRKRDESLSNIPLKQSKLEPTDETIGKTILTPEQKAAKEKKKEKMRIKKAAKKKQRDGQKNLQGGEEPIGHNLESTARLQALAYVQRWKNERHDWTFQKVRQVWLLKNMYDEKKVPEDMFPTLIEYLTGMKGQGREKTANDAQKILDDDSDETDTTAKKERARQIVQALT